jgi:hypothetical protein
MLRQARLEDRMGADPPPDHMRGPRALPGPVLPGGAPIRRPGHLIHPGAPCMPLTPSPGRNRPASASGTNSASTTLRNRSAGQQSASRSPGGSEAWWQMPAPDGLTGPGRRTSPRRQSRPWSARTRSARRPRAPPPATARSRTSRGGPMATRRLFHGVSSSRAPAVRRRSPTPMTGTPHLVMLRERAAAR